MRNRPVLEIELIDLDEYQGTAPCCPEPVEGNPGIMDVYALLPNNKSRKIEALYMNEDMTMTFPTGIRVTVPEGYVLRTAISKVAFERGLRLTERTYDSSQPHLIEAEITNKSGNGFTINDYGMADMNIYAKALENWFDLQVPLFHMYLVKIEEVEFNITETKTEPIKGF